MKVLALIVASFVVTILVMAAIAVLLFLGGHPSGPLLLLPILAVAGLYYGPLMLGAVTYYWDFSGSNESRKLFRRTLIILVAIDVVAVAALVVFSVSVGAPVWIPIALVAVGAVLFAVVGPIGRSLRRREERLNAHPSVWAPVDPGLTRRRVRLVIIVFSVTLVGGFILIAICIGVLAERRGALGDAAALAVRFAALAGAVVALFTTFQFAQAMRDTTRRDVTLTRKVAKVVLKNKPIELTDDEKPVAARYAAAAAVYLSFQLVAYALLYLGIGISLVTGISSGPTEFRSLNLVLAIALAVIVVGLFPLVGRQAVRARRYATAHAELAHVDPAPSPSSTSTTSTTNTTIES